MLTIQTHCCGETVTLENCVPVTKINASLRSFWDRKKKYETVAGMISATTTITGECPKCHKKHEETICSKTMQV